jgi:hypothetical protein
MMKYQRLVRIDDEVMCHARHAEITGELGRGIDAAVEGDSTPMTMSAPTPHRRRRELRPAMHRRVELIRANVWQVCRHAARIDLPGALDLLRTGKFAEKPARRLRISGVRRLRCWEIAEIVRSSILVDNCAPSAMVRRYALQSARIVSIGACICIVLRSGCAAKIGPAII